MLVDAMLMAGLMLLAAAKHIHNNIISLWQLMIILIICSASAGEAMDIGVRPSLSASMMSAPFLIRYNAILSFSL